MKRNFHDTGLCVPHKHYMVDTSAKIEKIIDLIERGSYFIMNRPRQFGKTTTMNFLLQILQKREDMLVLSLSFEGIGDEIFENSEYFAEKFVNLFNRELSKTYPQLNISIDENLTTKEKEKGFEFLSQQITDFAEKCGKEIVLMIDEVDKSTNNQLFLHFLGMLRDKYLKRDAGREKTFLSVVLAGVHDVKTIKLKLRPDEEKKINSPWNIAVDFTIDLSFSAIEIENMLVDYAKDKAIKMDIKSIALKLFHYTSGYPYLVSKMCKVIDEILLPEKENQQQWEMIDVENAFKYLADESYTTTLFDDLAKNLQNHIELYNLVYEIIFTGKKIPFSLADDEVVTLGHTYGILSKDIAGCKIHNRIFEQRIYMQMLTRSLRENIRTLNEPSANYVHQGIMDIGAMLQSFQQFMKENYTEKDSYFIEREGRLLFLAYLRPIINGKGHTFKEPNIGEERRLDVVVTYLEKKYVIELKIWRGDAYHQEGLQQLSDYLDIYNLDKGFLLIFNFNKNKEYKTEIITFNQKEIFAVWV